MTTAATTTAPTPTHRTRPSRVAVSLVVAAILAAAGSLASATPAQATTCPAAFATFFTDVPVDHTFCREIHAAHVEGWVGGYDDGTFRPTDVVSRQAAAAMLWAASNVDDGEVPTPCTNANPSGFSDVPNDHPFCPQIRDVALVGVFHGYDDGTFRPTDAITRQAAAAVLVRYYFVDVPVWALEVCDAPPFTDVPVGHPFCEVIDAVAALAISTGYPDGSFHPAEQVTRQAFVTFVGRTLVAPH